jgi:hypothetical protein
VESQSFIEHGKKVVELRNQWKEFNNSMQLELDELQKELAELDQEHKRFDSTVQKNLTSDSETQLRDQKLEEVRKMWGALEQHHEVNFLISWLIGMKGKAKNSR